MPIRPTAVSARNWLRLIAAALAATWFLVDVVDAQKAPATAADPARLAAAKELLEVSGAAKNFDAAMPMMLAQMQQIFMKLKPGNDKEIRDVFSKIGDRFSARKQEAFDEIAVLYAEKLTTEELKQISAFFRSGVGAKFIAQQPELVQRSMVIGQRWGEKIGREIEAEVRQELKKRGVDL